MDGSTESEDVDLDTVPVKALNVSSRMTLSWSLNPEQALRSSSGTARDYRGLAELMDFEINDIRNFQRHEDPTSKILEAWENYNGSTIGLLIEYLKQMDRFDVIEDSIANIKKDAQAYLRRNHSSRNSPIQVPEVTSCRTTISHHENPDALTVSDVQNGDCTYYDAYVCYAEEDRIFVSELAKYLESPPIGFRLFIKDRDLLLGTMEHESLVQLIQDRCARMLIIISPEFLKSRSCEFQASFAAGLAIEQQRRKLIPVVIRSCEVPCILKYVSKIDFTKPVLQSWIWDKLIQSIRGNSSCPSFVASQISVPLALKQAMECPELESDQSSVPVITFPPSAQHSLVYTNALIPSTEIQEIETSMTISKLAVSDTTIPKTTPPSKHKWLQNIRGRFSSNSSSGHASTVSTATSGYQSQNSLFSETSGDLE